MDRSQARIIRRVMIGEVVGAVFGIILALLLPVDDPVNSFAYRAGLVLFLTLAGAFIGFLGYYTVHPSFGFSLPWPLRGALAGFGLILVPLLLNLPAVITAASNLGLTGTIPPTLAVLAFGMIFGIVTDFICTRFAGEGPAP